ncbi:MAG TPA: F0F1 ATP synthase subunit alpha, partial [Acidimicrobiia bacterium]|nr:F0F1 ATP synthase subunit alpha [Acidimicrobiia bacterium]
EGFMDKVEVGAVQGFERGLLEHMRTRFGDVLDAIRDTGEIGDTDRLREAIQSYVDGFLAEASEG